VLGFAVPFTAISKHQQPVQNCWAETILLSQKPVACFDFSSSNFNLQSHILSTGGVALRAIDTRVFLIFSSVVFLKVWKKNFQIFSYFVSFAATAMG
jgi:hypothetical protein